MIEEALSFLVFFGGMAVCIWLLSWLSNIIGKVWTERNAGANNNEGESSIIEDRGHPVAAAIAAYQQQRNAHEIDRAKREGLTVKVLAATVAAAVGAALVSVVTVIVTHQDTKELIAETQTDAARQHDDILVSNRISREAFAAVQRAFIVVSPSLKIQVSRLADKGKTLEWSLRPKITNSGNTPTRNLRIAIIRPDQYDHATHCLMLNNLKASQQNFPGFMGQFSTYFRQAKIIGSPILDPDAILQNPDMIDEYYCASGTKPPVPDDLPILKLALGPKETIEPNLIESEITETVFDFVRNDEASSFYYGVLRYNDVFADSEEHVTKFCFNIEYDSTFLDKVTPFASLCTHWNCADAECENDKQEYGHDIATVPLAKAAQQISEEREEERQEGTEKKNGK